MTTNTKPCARNCGAIIEVSGMRKYCLDCAGQIYRERQAAQNKARRARRKRAQTQTESP